MSVEFVPLIAFMTGAITALITSQQAVSKALRLQQEILRRGASVQGMVLRVWRPPLAGLFTRIYFEFQPNGASDLVRACHIDRRSDGVRASLPAVGAYVKVHYLPESPRNAVISKLVSRFIS